MEFLDLTIHFSKRTPLRWVSYK